MKLLAPTDRPYIPIFVNIEVGADREITVFFTVDRHYEPPFGFYAQRSAISGKRRFASEPVFIFVRQLDSVLPTDGMHTASVLPMQIMSSNHRGQLPNDTRLNVSENKKRILYSAHL